MHTPAPWTAKDFRDLLASPGVFLAPSSVFKYPGGARGGKAPSHGATPEAAQLLVAFALGRVILDEAELLTLAVDPFYQRQGYGQTCLQAFERIALEHGARHLCLEVAASNVAALALYHAAGWTESGHRKGYYKGRDARTDAILMTKHARSD
ncbi:MAG: GNAT family N-acetyltransferase [Pseudomonadota bacterium]